MGVNDYAKNFTAVLLYSTKTRARVVYVAAPLLPHHLNFYSSQERSNIIRKQAQIWIPNKIALVTGPQ